MLTSSGKRVRNAEGDTLTMSVEKDYYAILGVAPDCDSAGLRDVFFAKARVLSPDRFDQKESPQEWAAAGRMLEELTEAYSVLKSPALRSEYDRRRAGGQSGGMSAPGSQKAGEPKAAGRPPPPPSTAAGSSSFIAGKAAFAALPGKTRAKLMARQNGTRKDIFKVRLSTGWLNVVYIVILLCWFGWLLYDGRPERMNPKAWLYAGITVTAALLIGRNIVTLLKRGQTTLGHYFYITDLYFIETHFDIVSFWPLWDLEKLSVQHQHDNGAYKKTDITFKFHGHDISFSLSDKNEVAVMQYVLRLFNDSLRGAVNRRDYAWLAARDDFLGVSQAKASESVLVPKLLSAAIYAMCLAVCMSFVKRFGLLQFTKAPLPPTRVEVAKSAGKSFDVNDLEGGKPLSEDYKAYIQELEYCRKFIENAKKFTTILQLQRTTEKPFDVNDLEGGEPLSEENKAYLDELSAFEDELDRCKKFVQYVEPQSLAGTVVMYDQGLIDNAPAPNPLEIRRKAERVAASLRDSGKAPPKFNLNSSRRSPADTGKAAPRVAARVNEPALIEKPLPYSGTVKEYTSAPRVAPLEIKAAAGSHYLVKLVSVRDGSTAMTVFVRSSTTVKVQVPLGTFEIRYAAGSTWYGYGNDELFGPETSCSKADSRFRFAEEEFQITGYSITLYKVRHGNLHTSKIDRSKF